MSNVIEFSSARLQLHRFVLDQLGLDPPLSWRVVGRPHDRVVSGQLCASPFLIAHCRDGRTCVASLRRGAPPQSLEHAAKITAALDAAVVSETLVKRGYALTRTASWIVFDDGSRHEIDEPPAVLRDLLDRAHIEVRARQLTNISTRTVASFL